MSNFSNSPRRMGLSSNPGMFQWALWTRRDFKSRPLEKNIVFVQRNEKVINGTLYKVATNIKVNLDISYF